MEPITVLGIAIFIGLPLLMITIRMVSGSDKQAELPKYKPRVKK